MQLQHTAKTKHKKKKTTKHSTQPKITNFCAPASKQFLEIKIIQIRIFPGKPKISCEAGAYPGILFGEGGVQQIQLRTERTGIWGAIAP